MQSLEEKAKRRAKYATSSAEANAKRRARHAANPEKRNAKQRAQYATNPEPIRASVRAQRAKNLDHSRALDRERYVLKNRKDEQRQRRAANPEHFRTRDNANYANSPTRFENHLKRAYGITLAQHAAMFTAQCGLCKLCKSPLKPGRGTNVDHAHETQTVRGLLCPDCNKRLGHIEKAPAGWLSLAWDYIQSGGAI